LAGTNECESAVVDKLDLPKLPKNYRWRIAKSPLDGYVRVYLQHKEWFFWNSLTYRVSYPSKYQLEEVARDIKTVYFKVIPQAYLGTFGE